MLSNPKPSSWNLRFCEICKSVQQQLVGSSVALVSCVMIRLQLIEKAELEAMSDQQLEVAGPVQLLPVTPHHLDLGVVIVVLGKLLHCCLKLRHSACNLLPLSYPLGEDCPG